MTPAFAGVVCVIDSLHYCYHLPTLSFHIEKKRKKMRRDVLIEHMPVTMAADA